MNCPKCRSQGFDVHSACPACGFQGSATHLEQLAHVIFLLGEISSWIDIPARQRSDLHQRYFRQRHELERSLGLLPPTLNGAEAQAAYLKLEQIDYILRTIPTFFEPRGINIPVELQNELSAEAGELSQRLANAPAFIPPFKAQLTLACYRFLNQTLQQWQAQGRLPETPALLEANRAIEKWLSDLEIQLGIRAAEPASHQSQPAPIRNDTEAQAAHLRLKQVNYILRTIPAFFEPRGIKIPAGLQNELTAEAEALQQRLTGAPAFVPPSNDQLTFACYRFLNETLHQWRAQGHLPETPALLEAHRSIEGWLANLETRLSGPAAAPVLKEPPPASATPTIARSQPAPAPAKPAVPPGPPRQPWTWDRVWDTLVSKRTLNVMLFLGVGLLVAAAVSLVVWNWNAFPPLAQVGFLALFTATFYGLGWYVRTRLKLRGSGIALSAFASLLVPLDIYAIYLSGGFPHERWAEVWWAASLLCMLAYGLTVYLIQAEFFGYLVALAGGSLLCATSQLLGIGMIWWQAGLAAYALVLGLVAEALFNEGPARWKVIASPIWLLALTADAVILVWNFALGLTTWRGDLDFRLALALTWWLGGLLFTFAAGRAHSRTFTLAAAAIYPLAVLITQAAIFPRLEISVSWYALGLALLAPLYLAFSHWSQEAINREIARWVGTLLIIIPALWALSNVSVAAIVHPLLAVTVILASRWWQRPRWLYATSLLLLTGGAAFVASRGLALGQIGLAWGLLAIGLVVAGNVTGRGKSAAEAPFAGPLYTSAGLAGALSLLPPLVFFERGLLAYTLGNWSALNGWLALLEHEGKIVVARHRFVPPVAFQWMAALSLPLWAWQTWLFGHPGWLPLALVALLLAWAFLAWGSWLRRVAEHYAAPWYTAGEFCAAWAVLLAFPESQNWMVVLFIGSAAYYFVAAAVKKQSQLLWPASLLFPLGLCLALDLAYLLPEAQPVLLALVLLAYLSLAGALERWGGWQRDFLLPVYRSLYWIGTAGFALSLSHILRFILQYWEMPDAQLMWSAATVMLLGIVFALRAWLQKNRLDAYLATWLGALACGLAAAGYSHGTGRSAVFGAVAAWGYILLERWLTRPGRFWKPTRYREPARSLRYLFRWPLITSAWLLSAGAIALALVRNLILLEGTTPARWAVVALWLIVGLYAASGWMYYRWQKAQTFLYVAAGLAFIPWTLMIWLIWPQYGQAEYAEGWAVLAAIEWLLGAWLIRRSKWGGDARLLRRSQPWLNVAQIVMPAALIFSMTKSECAVFALGVGVAFYTACTWLDWRMDAKRADERFLYIVALLLPIWAGFILSAYFPGATRLHYAALLLAFSLPALGFGRWLAHHQPSYRMPFYWLAYLILVPGTFLAAAADVWAFVGALLLGTLVGGLSMWLFRQPVWAYPSTATLTLAWLVTLNQWNVSNSQSGWGLMALAGCYLLAGRAIHQVASRRQSAELRAYATPLVVSGLILGTLSLLPSGADARGILLGYTGVAVLYAFCAFWLQKPVFLGPSVLFSGVAYLGLLDIWQPGDYSLASWPWIAATLAAAIGLDRSYGGGQPFLWDQFWLWPQALAKHLWQWWAFPFYAGGFAAAALSGVFASNHTTAAINWLLAGAAYGLAIYLFRRRLWLLVCAGALQLSALHAIVSMGSSTGSAAGLALYFSPVMWVTLLMGLWLEDRLAEGAPLGLAMLKGWSRPLYLLALIDVFLLQGAATFDLQAASMWVTLSHALAASLLAFWWQLGALAYLALAGGIFALGQGLAWNQAEAFSWPWAFSLLVLVYGLCGYILRYGQRKSAQAPQAWVKIWENPLIVTAWILSLASLAIAAMLGLNFGPALARAFMGLPLLDAETTRQVQMGVGVLAVLGIFYLTAALVEKHRWLAYGAVALLIGAWSLEWLVVWGQREIQWYVVPTGLYLLAVSYFEWIFGDQYEKDLARGLDRAAMLLLLGSAFWQSLDDHGGRYALLMGAECLLFIWWGSARRLRRFLYIGVVGMTLNVFGQMIDPLLSTNRWIVFGVVGGILVALAILIERRMETVIKMSEDVRKRLEDWE